LGGAPDVDRLARKGNAAGLARALSYEDVVSGRDGRPVDLGAHTRAAAAAALVAFDGPGVEAALVQGMRDPEEEVRLAAIRAFGERGGTSAIEPLLAATIGWTHPELEVSRAAALDALAGLRARDVPRRAANELIVRAEDLGDADLGILPVLAGALGPDLVWVTIGVLIANLGEGPASVRSRKLLVPFGAAGVEPLVGALSDPARRREAALALGAIHDSRAVEPLAALVLDGAEPPEREAAAWALGEIRDPAAVEALLRATRDADYSVRTEAIAGFDKLGNAAITVAIGGMIQRALESAAEATQVEAPAEPPAQVEAPREPATAQSPAAPVAPNEQLAPRAARPGRPLLRRLLERYVDP
jgi:HEAT repeat protein